MSVRPPLRSNLEITCSSNIKLEGDDIALIQDSIQLGSRETQVRIKQNGLHQKINGTWQLSPDKERNKTARAVWGRVFKGNPSPDLTIKLKRTTPISSKNAPLPLRPNLPRVTDELLAFIHGDSFVSASGYEGGNVIENTEFLLNYIKSKPAHKVNPATIAKLESLVELDRSYPLPSYICDADDVQNFHSAASRYSKALSLQVAALLPGEKMLMRGGWLNSGGGHALLYIIEKLPNGAYAFTVVNTGGGIDAHGNEMQGLKRKYRPILRYKEISAEKISDPRFFQALLELRMPSDIEGKPLEHSAKDIYDRILPTLGGIRDFEYENATALITSQKSGSCSWKVLLKLLQIEMEDPEDYKPFVFELKKDSLQSYFQFDFLQNQCNDEQVQLLQHSAQGFARYALRQFEAGFIDETELEEAEALGEAIEREILAREQSLTQSQAKAIDYRSSRLYFSHFRSAPLIDPTPLTTPGVHLPRVGLGPLEGLEMPPHALSELNVLLEEVLDHCTQLSEAENHATAIETLKEMVKIIPPKAFHEEGYWKEILKNQSREEVERTMENLLKMSQLLFCSIASLEKTSRGSPEHFALMATLMAFNQFLSWHLGEEWQPETRYDPWITFPFFNISDPKLKTLFNESIAFMDQCKEKKGPNSEFRPSWEDPKLIKFKFTSDNNYITKKSFLKPYFEQLIQKDAQFAHLKGRSDREIFAFFLPLIGKPDFPAPLRTLFTQSQLMDYFENNPYLEEFSRKKTKDAFCLLVPQPSKKEELNFKRSVAGVDSLKTNNFHRIWSGRDYTSVLEHPFYKHLTPFSKLGAFRLAWSQLASLKRKKDPCYLSNWNGEVYNAASLPKMEGFTLREGQEIGHMLSKSETFVPHFLSYLKEHPCALQDRDFQLLIHYVFLDEGILENSLKTFPSTAPKLVSFLREQLELHQKLGDIQAQLYFLELISCVNKCLSKPELYLLNQGGFPKRTNVTKRLKNLLRSIEDTSLSSRRLKAIIYTQTISLFHSTQKLSSEEVIRLSIAYSYIQAHGFDSHLSHPFIKQQMEEVMNRVANSPYMKDPATQLAIVEGISEEVLRFKEGEWNGKFPIFYDATHTYRMDLSTFSLFEGDLLIGALPTHIAKDPSFNHLFSQKKFQVREIETGLYTFTTSGPPKEETYRVFTAKENHQVVIQKQQGNAWLTYISPETLYEALPKGLVAGYHPWMIKENENQFILTIEDDYGSPTARLKGEVQPNGSWFISSCMKQPNDPTQPPLFLQNEDGSPLSQFQEKGFFLNWGMQILAFPKARIQFRMNTNDGKAYFSDNPKLHLSENQAPPKTLPLYQGSLLLQDKEGNCHFLFPREPVYMGHGALKRAIDVQHAVRDGAYFQIKEKQGLLTGSTPEENLFLAYLHIGHKNYKEACRLLAPQLAGSPKGYSAREEMILAWIFTMIGEMQDPSPESCAAQLQILHLSLRNLNKESQQTMDLKSRIVNGLTSYYPLSHHLTSLAPSPLQLYELQEASGFSSPSTNRSVIETSSLLLSNYQMHSLASDLKKLSWNPDIQIRALFSVYGPSKLAHHFDRYLPSCLSEIDAEREDLIKELDLLKIPSENASMDALRKTLKKIARHPDHALRNQLALDMENTYNILENKLELLQKAEAQLDKELPVSKTLEVPVPMQKAMLPKKQPRVKKRSLPNLTFISPEQKLYAQTSLGVAFKQPIQELLASQGIILQEAPLTENAAQTEELVADLAPAPADEKASQKEFTRVQNSFVQNEKERLLTQRYFFTPEQLEEMHPLFQKRKEMLKAFAEKHKADILTLANTLPQDHVERIQRSLEHLGKQREKITLDDLIILYLQNNGEGLARRNPDLTQEQVNSLTLLIQNYLAYATEAAHFERLEKIAEETLTLQGPKQEEALLRLDMTLREERQYDDFNEDKALLIFEHYSEKRLRKKQVELIRQMQLTQGVERQNLIAQLIMGSGKSKVILVLLAYLNSDGEHAPVIIVPDMLYETNLEDMRIGSGETVHQSPYTFILKKGEPIDQTKLDEIEKMQERMKKERSYCVIQESTIKALLLQYNALIVSLGSVPEGKAPSPELEARFRQLTRVLNTLLQDAIIDEPDMILDYLKQMNLAHGEWTRVSNEVQTTLEQVFLEIAANDQLSEFFQLERESDAPFDPLVYQNQIKPRLAEIILKIAKLDACPPDQKTIFLQYLLSDSDLKKVPPEIREASRALRNQLSLGKELIATLFPFTLNNICNQNFGMSRQHNSFQAIPYARKDTPNEGSEFSSPFVTMLFTTYYYTRKGVSADAIKKLISECKAQAIQQNRVEGTPFKETEGYLRFAALNVVPEKDLFSIQEGDVDELVQEVNRDVNKRIAFSRNFGWREIGSFNRRLSINAQYIAGAFRWILGFTGTLGNMDSLPQGLNPIPEVSTDGKILAQIHASHPKVTSHQNLDSFYASLAHYDACIDTGAWFRGIPEKQVALQMLSHLPERIKGIVYFNDIDIPPETKGQAVILERGKENYPPQLLSKSSVPEEERFTYFNVTTGADVAQHPLAKAIMTLGKNLLLSEYIQGAGRMRGLHFKQTIDFAIPADLDPFFPQKTCNEIFRFCTDNQAVRQTKDNLGSLKAQIYYLGESVVLEALKDLELPLAQVLSLCRSAIPLLAPPVSIEPVDLFEEIDEEVSIDKVVEHTIETTMKTMRQIYSENPWLEKRKSLGDLEKSMHDIVNFDVLPEKEKMVQKTSYAMETHTVRMTETQTQTQVQAHLQRKAQLQQEILEQGEKEAYDRTILSLGNVFSEEYFQNEMQTRSVNAFLISRKKELKGFRPKRKVFSENLTLSDRMGPDQSLVPDGKSSILFQRGTLPVATCALKIFPNGKMEMAFVDPNEAEFLSRSIDLARGAQELREKEDQSSIPYEDILMDELMKELRSMFYDQDLVEASQNHIKENGPAQVFDPKQIYQLLKENKTEELQYLIRGGLGYWPWFFMEQAAIRGIQRGSGERKNFFAQKDFELVLVDPKIGIVKQGLNPVDENALKKDRRYIALCTQAKFYNGDLDSYTPAEIEYLRGWINHYGAETMLALLLNILRARPADMARLPNSVLYRVFQTLNVMEDENKED